MFLHKIISLLLNYEVIIEKIVNQFLMKAQVSEGYGCLKHPTRDLHCVDAASVQSEEHN